MHFFLVGKSPEKGNWAWPGRCVRSSRTLHGVRCVRAREHAEADGRKNGVGRRALSRACTLIDALKRLALIFARQQAQKSGKDLCADAFWESLRTQPFAGIGLRDGWTRDRVARKRVDAGHTEQPQLYSGVALSGVSRLPLAPCGWLVGAAGCRLGRR